MFTDGQTVYLEKEELNKVYPKNQLMYWKDSTILTLIDFSIPLCKTQFNPFACTTFFFKMKN